MNLSEFKKLLRIMFWPLVTFVYHPIRWCVQPYRFPIEYKFFFSFIIALVTFIAVGVPVDNHDGNPDDMTAHSLLITGIAVVVPFVLLALNGCVLNYRNHLRSLEEKRKVEKAQRRYIIQQLERELKLGEFSNEP